MEEKLTTLFQKYISNKIPKFATNILYQVINGVEAMFTTLEYRLNISKRERNILTAQQLSSLRNLVAQNGLEPTLKIPSKGLLQMQINAKLFNRVGFPLFIKPYCVFTNKLTKIQYIYNGNKTIKLSNNKNLIPVIEGEIKTINNTITEPHYIERIYIGEDNLAEGSIIVLCNNIQFQEVKSFADNEGINNNKQFLVKFSNDAQNPIIIYIKGLNFNDVVYITYRLTFGENGNISGQQEFETDDIINSYGDEITVNDDELTIINVNGFNLGSNGTDENALRAAIGYNHGAELLFDVISYTNFINKFSTVLLQKVLSNENYKTIKNIYLSKKQIVIDNNNVQNIIQQYKSIVTNNTYLLTSNEKINLSELIKEKEFSLTSHNLNNSNINKYALQIKFDSKEIIDLYSDDLNKLIYLEFSKFFFIKNHQINFELLFDTFMITNNIKLEYTLFDENNEKNKIENQKYFKTSTIIIHDDYLPILKGDFNICDYQFNTFQLFSDINIINN
ncbi:hypothetical protein M0Q97_02185 [Candidatus Dojkabacteria bacterium]|jgi:hypothetical protein|nr:hypothetical protein [Candidatus Dojkabacteria bacterium]